MDIETEKSRRLTKDPGIDACAAWSPDGQWIAFCSDRSGRMKSTRWIFTVKIYNG